MTARRRSCCRATAARIWRRCFSMLRAAANVRRWRSDLLCRCIILRSFSRKRESSLRAALRACGSGSPLSRGRTEKKPVTAQIATFSPARVGAMVRRYWYLLRSSWPRILDLIYWPAVQMLMWGFLQLYVSQNASFFAQAAGVFIGSVLLWDILFRGQLGFSISFLEEMYSHNMANLMMSPLRPVEFVAALM